MKKYLIMLAALVFAACGAAEEPETELGTTEQAFTTKITTGPGRTLGVLSGGCSPLGSDAVHGSTEACLYTVPNAVTTIVVGLDPASESQRFRDGLIRAVAGLNANMPSGFAHFQLLSSGIAGAHVVFFNDPTLQGPGVGVRKYNGMLNGIGFECSTAALVDSPNEGGQFRTFLASGGAAGPQEECSMSINLTQINTDFPNATQRAIVIGNSVANVLVEMVGLGNTGHSNSFITAATDPLLDPTLEKFGIAPGQLCLLQHYTFGTQTQWHESTAAPCANYPVGM